MTKPDPRLSSVPQAPEQERGCHPDDEEADQERDQPPVDERERRQRAARTPPGPRRESGRRANSGSAISATAGTQNQSVVLGASCASLLKTSWSIAAIAKSTIKRSNP